MNRTPSIWVRRAFSNGLVDCRDANSGDVRLVLVTSYVVIPLGVGALVGWRAHHALDFAALFPAAALMAGMLMGAVSLLFGRVKDLVASGRPAVGRDPVYFAMVAFRTATWCVQVALVLNLVLLMSLVIPGLTRVLLGVAVGLMIHLGMKIWNLVRGMGAQAAGIAGSRAVPPAPLYDRDSSSAGMT